MHTHGVEGDLVLGVLGNDRLHLADVVVAIAALVPAKGPVRRLVVTANLESAELIIKGEA
jgi:hypothetical protein